MNSMKGFFKRIVLLFAATLAITSCDSLIPIRRPGRSNNSSSQFSLNTELKPGPDYIQITHEEDPIRLVVGETFTTNHYLHDNNSFTNLHILENSEATSFDKKLEVSFECYFDHLAVTLYSKTQGRYSYEVYMVSGDGYEYSEKYDVIVSSMSNQCYAEYGFEQRFGQLMTYSLNFRVCDPITNSYLRLKKDQPFYINYVGEGITIKNGYLSAPYELMLEVRTKAVELESAFSITLITSTEALFEATVHYTIGNPGHNYYVNCDIGPIVIETNSYVDACFSLIDAQTGERVELYKDFCGIESYNSEFGFDLIQVDAFFMKVRITNNNSYGMAEFYITLMSADDYKFTGCYQAYSKNYYDNALIVNFDFCHDGSAYYLNITVCGMDGARKMIKTLHISSERNILANNETFENLNVYEYDYYLKKQSSAEDTINVDIETSDGRWASSGISISI